MKPLDDSDYAFAAKELGLPAVVIKTVTEVECPGPGFYEDKTPKILFERHVMYKRVRDKFGLAQADAMFRAYPEICNPKAGGYGPSIDQPTRMGSAAKLIDRTCALESASWGKFQIMGYHWKALDYPSLQYFINAMYSGERAQLIAFVDFLKEDPKLIKALENRDWAAFAEGYNGPAYKINDYDIKLAKAYKKNGGK